MERSNECGRSLLEEHDGKQKEWYSDGVLQVFLKRAEAWRENVAIFHVGVAAAAGLFDGVAADSAAVAAAAAAAAVSAAAAAHLHTGLAHVLGFHAL